MGRHALEEDRLTDTQRIASRGVPRRAICHEAATATRRATTRAPCC